MSESACYEIRLLGELAPEWAEWFDPLKMTTLASGETLLAGVLPDQAALHGVLARVRDMGLPLVSVIRRQYTEAVK